MRAIVVLLSAALVAATVFLAHPTSAIAAAGIAGWFAMAVYFAIRRLRAP